MLNSVEFTLIFVQVQRAAITTRVKHALRYRGVAGAIRLARVYPAARVGPHPALVQLEEVDGATPPAVCAMLFGHFASKR